MPEHVLAAADLLQANADLQHSNAVNDEVAANLAEAMRECRAMNCEMQSERAAQQSQLRLMEGEAVALKEALERKSSKIEVLQTAISEKDKVLIPSSPPPLPAAPSLEPQNILCVACCTI